MKGDFTRFSHQSHRHYAGVLMQQGRVTLDADWNEQFEIDDHRWRIQTIDTISRACAPADAPGFGLAPTPDGSDLIITPGRIYLDGVLVEIPPGTAVRVDAVESEIVTVRDLAPDGRPFEEGQWVEVTGEQQVVLTRIVAVDASASTLELADDVGAFADAAAPTVRRVITYLTQPYYPATDPTLANAFTPEDWGGRTHLVYLDVWRRHVTAIEDPHLREVALGGPDTATRVQTVWAVRILHDDGEPVRADGLSCDSEIEAWDALTAPSAGRLSARAEAAPDPEDPCAIEPEAGYRGLENRLYRVEVHTPGPRGVATFKWSRDNGSVLSSIVNFPSPTEIDVRSLGKDRVLRFSADDRVEVLSDDTDFAGVTGTMASIVGAPDEAERRIALDQDVSAHHGQRRPRVRRWDHAGPEPVTAGGWVDLDLGVQVRFGEGPFHTGDYWVIPARVATGDVEGFVDAPPRGIEHHYARLGFVTWGDDGTVLDCRHRFVGLCDIEAGDGDHCCTVSVGDDGDVATLAEAIGVAREVGGPVRICVLPGEHRLADQVLVDVSELTISGCGRRSRLVAADTSALHIVGVSDVRLEDLVISSGSREPTVAVAESEFVEIVDCRISNRGRTRPVPIDNLRSPTGNLMVNHLGEPTERAAPDDAGEFGGAPFEVPASVDSYVLATDVPRSLGPAVATTATTTFQIQRCVLSGLPAVSAQGDDVAIEHNLIVGGGIWLREGTEDALVVDNRIRSGHAYGVLLGGLQPNEPPREARSGLRSVTIRGNRIARMSREGIATPLADDERLGETDGVVIEHNEITECGLAPLTDQFAMGGGILLVHVTDVSIHGNRVAANGPPPESAAFIRIGFGIVFASASQVDVSDNTVLDNGAGQAEEGQEGIALNVGIAGLFVVPSEAGASRVVLEGAAFRVHDNEVRVESGLCVAAVATGPVSVSDNQLLSRYPGRGTLSFGRALLILNFGFAPDLYGSFSWAGMIAGRAQTSPPLHGRVQVDGNQVTVQSGDLPVVDVGDDDPIANYRDGSAVAVLSFDDVSIRDNQVLNEVFSLEGASIASTVWVSAATARAGGNRISEFWRTAAYSYAGFAIVQHVIDNITTHCIQALGPNSSVEHNSEAFCARLGVREIVGATHYRYGG